MKKLFCLFSVALFSSFFFFVINLVPCFASGAISKDVFRSGDSEYSAGDADQSGNVDLTDLLIILKLLSDSLIHIQTSNGNEILTFAPSKRYQSVVFSSSELTKGSTYEVYYGGSSTGTVNDGLYQNGTYTLGTKYTSFTISNIVTNVGGSNPRP